MSQVRDTSPTDAPAHIIRHEKKTVGVTAVEAECNGSTLERKYVTIYHNSTSGFLYYGGEGVTTATGTPIPQKQLFPIPCTRTCKVYVISDTAGQDVRFTEGE